MKPRFYIGTKRGTNLGVVYDETGTIIGRVMKKSRVAAGLKGARRPFYTAMVTLPDGTTAGCSLGTRHPDRWSAARAIRKFHTAYPTASYAGIAGNAAAQLGWLTGAFKRDYWRDCALPYQTIR